MNTLVLLLICIAILVCGYIFYGRWLCKQWGVGENDEPTPAHTLEDGVDYVPAKAPVLMGHHFSSIAGAGPITGPIGAAIFGWVPVVLWVLVGGIFFGGVHDFGALFASLRHKGQSIGEIISANMGRRAKRLFITFAYLTLILVVAAFASIVAGTFGNTNAAGEAVSAAAVETNASVAMVSLLFILIAIVFGFLVYRRNVPMGTATVIGVIAIVACMAIGMSFHPIYLSYKAWMIIVGIYIAVASVTPVWILLQPRDYLSSFLLYAMLAVALVGVVISMQIWAEQMDFRHSKALLLITVMVYSICSLYSLQLLPAVLFPVSILLYHLVQHPNSLIRRRTLSLLLTVVCFLNVYLQLLQYVQSTLHTSTMQQQQMVIS